jgi:hypothetical protein
MSKPFNWDSMPQIADPTPPAIGVAWDYTVPAGKRVVIYTIGLRLITSAVVINRNLYLQCNHGAGTPVWNSIISLNQTASQTNYYLYAAGNSISDGTDQVIRTFTMPNILYLKPGDHLLAICANMQVADQMTPWWMAKEGPV